MPKRVRGAVAIEFALIFSVLFGLFYAIVSYALPLMMMQTFHAATADGTRAAVSVVMEQDDDGSDTCTSSYKSEVKTVVENAIEERIGWLDSLMSRVPKEDRWSIDVCVPPDSESETSEGGDEEAENFLKVTVQYPNYTDNPPIPILTLPLIGRIPRLPDSLSASASIRL